mgnify:CR=1 FL=1
MEKILSRERITSHTSVWLNFAISRCRLFNNNESRSWVLVRPPSPDTGDAVKVTLGVNAFKLLNVDERTGQMTATFFEHRVSLLKSVNF